MRHPRSTRALVVAAMAAALCGCTVEGTVTIRSAKDIDLDLTVSHAPDRTMTVNGETIPVGGGPCTADASPLRPLVVVEQLGTPEAPRCRLTGTLDAETVGSANYLAAGNGHLFLAFPLVANGDEPTSLDVRLAFPGQVVAATGAEALGRVAHLRQEIPAGQDEAPRYVHVVARDAGPPLDVLGAGLLAATAGLGLGAAGYALARTLCRRRVAPAAGPDDPGAPAVAAPAAVIPAEQDPGVWAPTAEDVP